MASVGIHRSRDAGRQAELPTHVQPLARLRSKCQSAIPLDKKTGRAIRSTLPWNEEETLWRYESTTRLAALIFHLTHIITEFEIVVVIVKLSMGVPCSAFPLSTNTGT
jgi:hypothetical protein